MTRFAEVVYALLRILTGLLFASHGAQKLFGLFGSPRMVDSPLLVTAGVIELVCGLAVAAGFLARPAAFLASGEMAVAYFMKHAPQSFWPIQNHGESAVLYCFLFLLVTASGAGIWSVDGLRRTEHEAAEPAAPAMATRSPV